MLVVDWRRLTRTVHGGCILQLQQIILRAAMLESWRPTAGHDGRDGQTPSSLKSKCSSWSGPEALIEGNDPVHKRGCSAEVYGGGSTVLGVLLGGRRQRVDPTKERAKENQRIAAENQEAEKTV